MSAHRDLDRQIQSFLAEGPMELPDSSYDEVRDRMEQKRQRAFIGPWRTPTVNNLMKIGLAAAAVVVAFVGYQVISGPSVGDPSPSPSASAAPSAAQSAAPSELPFGADQPLSPGTYSLYEGFPVAITFEVPAGWVSCTSGLVEQGACKPSTDTEPQVGVAFLIVDNVVADPCTMTELDPPVGPSVDDLVTAITNLEGFEATPVADLTVDGFSGKEFTLTAPRDAGCRRLSTWTTASGTNGVGPDEVNLLRILDVDGVRVMISGAYQTATSEEQLAAIQQVIASVHIEP